ncbi:hypothetical protein NPIL_438161, partial [Nephila pilipes]
MGHQLPRFHLTTGIL